MPSSHRPRRPLVRLAVLLLLGLLGAASCRSPEPPAASPAKNEPASASSPYPAALSPAAITSEPTPVSPTSTALKTATSPVNLQVMEEAPSLAPDPDPTPAPPHRPHPQLAIIIDDMGYNPQAGEQLLQLGSPLSFSFLPEAPHTRELAREAFRQGHDILAHLPMEPKDRSKDAGSSVLLTGDDPERITKKMAGMLAAVPHAIGANNHMGSRFTEDAGRMRTVLEILGQRRLFFIDSYTTPHSQGLAVARQLRLPSARRHVFLDNLQDPEAICTQMGLLAAQAKMQGQAIGIGHPHPATITALARCSREAFSGLDLVGVHQLVQRQTPSGEIRDQGPGREN